MYPLSWIATAYLMALIPRHGMGILLHACGVVIIGICIQAMGILMHEALHGNLFKSPIKNSAATFIYGIPAFFSGTAYKVAHLNHHRHTRTEQDQDEISNLCNSSRQYRALYYVWFIAGTFLYFFIVPGKALSIGSPPQRIRILCEYSVMFGIYALVLVWGLRQSRLDELVWYWLVPAQVAMLFSNIRGHAEHLGTLDEGALTRTRTTRSNSLTSFLMLNLNYHLEHHLFPRVPWYNLRRLHNVLQPVYRTADPFIERSYARYAVEAILKGPFQTIRDPKRGLL
jgi:fatty acid desaturase